MKTILCALLSGVSVFGQASVSLSTGPDVGPINQIENVYNGSNQLIATCYSPSVVTSGVRAQKRVSVSAASNATAAVLTSTGHGFKLSTRPSITLSGGTGNWTAINGTFVATIIDVDTFSIPVNSSAFGALAGTIVFSTTAPRKTMYEWKVRIFTYDGSGNPTGNAWLSGGAGNQRCSDATSTTIQLQ